jgi:hypothetical protein
MVENKLEQMQNDKHAAYQKFEHFENQYEEMKLDMVDEEQMLKNELERVKEQAKLKDLEL